MSRPFDDHDPHPPTLSPDAPTEVGEPGSPTAPAFEPGDLLANRYRVRRFLARGGMGEVYEAEDLELRSDVALKTLRRELASDDAAVERFRREILLSRRVTHPNVCRVFEVFRHQRVDGSTVFLTMELLPGETLSQRIRRRGRLRPRDAAPIVQQLCGALAAAHAADVVHRDFKTANVILVPAVGGERAVVTDFGLARALDLPPGDDSRQKRVGTSAYMAPEQVQGGEITVATDVYALGIVMFEMVTGRVPFLGSTPLATAMKRLREPPPAPRSLVPDLDPAWETVILRCLARDPGDRFPDVASVWTALGPAIGRRRAKLPLFAAGAAVALLAGLGVVRLRHAAPPDDDLVTPSSLARNARRSAAVLGLKNLGQAGDGAWLGAALSEMLSTELAAGGRLRIVPGENVSRMKVELSLPEEESLARDTLQRIRANLGTDVVVLGSYVAVPPATGDVRRVRIDVRVQDTRLGDTVALVTDTGNERELLDLVSRVGGRLRAALGAGALSDAEAGGLRATLPATPEAARLYTAGLERLRRFDAPAARGLLEQASAADPDHPLVHAALADAWAALGYDGKAEAEARRAMELASRLPHEEGLLVRARFCEHTRDWPRAIEAYATLARSAPDDGEFGLRLAAAQIAGGRAQDAVASLDAVRAIPTADGRPDPRIDLEEAAAASALSDYRRVQAAAERASATGTRLGARLLVAQARSWQGWALWHLGDPEEARQAYEDARAISASAGDRVGEARALRGLGTVLAARGELGDALRLFREALTASRETGRRGAEALALSNIGSVLYKQGDLHAAQETFQQALELRREIGGSGGLATSLANVANVMQDLGDLGSARRLHEEALSLKRGVGEKLGVALGLNSLGDVRLAEGDLDGAQRLYEESHATAEEIGSRRSAAYSLSGLGEIRLAHGDLAGARRAHAEALAIRQSLEERGNVAASRLAIAGVDLEDRRPGEAEAAARAVAEEFKAEGRPVEQALAEALEARALLALGRPADARREADLAVALVTRTDHVGARTQVALVAGRVRAAQNRPAEAVRLIEGALQEARRLGLTGLILEARLALAELDVANGRGDAARRELPDLERDARAAGFGLVAGRAAALSGGLAAAR